MRKRSVYLLVLVSVGGILAGSFFTRTQAPSIKPTPASDGPQQGLAERHSNVRLLSRVPSSAGRNIHSEEAVPAHLRDAVEARVMEAIRTTLGRMHSARTESDVRAGASIDEQIADLHDTEVSLKLRRQAVWSLARSGDYAALTALAEVLRQPGAPPYLKAAIGEALGHSSHPDARALLESMLADADGIAVRGAIRGLAAIGDWEAVTMLAEVLSSEQHARSVRMEAAAGLGNIELPEAHEALVEAYAAVPGEDQELAAAILEGLGARDIAETKVFFEEVLDPALTPTELRVGAIEGLENASGHVGAFLITYAADPDAKVRAAAAWALATVDDPGDRADALLTLLDKEENAEVRKRLYQALGNQDDVDALAISGSVFEERDQAARLAGYDLLASSLTKHRDLSLEKQFVETAVPQLQETALTAPNLSERLGAVIALKKAKLPESAAALERIATTTSDPRIAEATGPESDLSL